MGGAKVGTINKSKEIKTQDGTWKYVGNKLNEHPIARDLIKKGFTVTTPDWGIPTSAFKKEKIPLLHNQVLLETEEKIVYRITKNGPSTVVETMNNPT